MRSKASRSMKASRGKRLIRTCLNTRATKSFGDLHTAAKETQEEIAVVFRAQQGITTATEALLAERLIPRVEPTNIAAAARGKLKSHPRNLYGWVYPPMHPARPGATWYTFKTRSAAVQAELQRMLKCGTTPPTAVSDRGEILRKDGSYTLGNQKLRNSTKDRYFGSHTVSRLVSMYCCDSVIPDHLQVNHKDGAGEHYSPFTYVDEEETTYTNRFDTMYLGTSRENQQDLVAHTQRQALAAVM